MNLKQGSMSFRDYDHEFTRLCTYTPELVATEEMKYKKYLYGLEKELHLTVVGFQDRYSLSCVIGLLLLPTRGIALMTSWSSPKELRP